MTFLSVAVWLQDLILREVWAIVPASLQRERLLFLIRHPKTLPRLLRATLNLSLASLMILRIPFPTGTLVVLPSPLIIRVKWSLLTVVTAALCNPSTKVPLLVPKALLEHSAKLLVTPVRWLIRPSCLLKLLTTSLPA